MEEECEMGRAATPLLTRAHANAAATTRPIVAAADNPAERGRARQRRQRAERGAA